MKENSVIKNSFVLAAGAFIAKLLGALYRIPLTSLLGSYGLGLYQTVFPVYALLLDFAGAALPSALSKIISSGREEKEKNAYSNLVASVKLLALIGGVFSILIAVLSRFIATAQGNDKAYLSYIALSPSVFLFAVISCLRGYFQGLSDMKPTAVSQIIEQGIKLGFGILAVRLLLPNVPVAVAGAVFSVTLSELFALVYLFAVYKIRRKKHALYFEFNKSSFPSIIKTVLKTAFPITLVGLALPFSHFLDSFLVVNILGGYRADATSLYGLMSGAVATVINLPVAICYGVSASAIPSVSSAIDEEERTVRKQKALLLTFALSFSAFLVCFFFSGRIVHILYGGLSYGESKLASDMLYYESCNIVFASLLQTENAILFGEGKLYRPLVGTAVGVALKTALNILLLGNPVFNIYGGVIAQIACYFVASLINLNLIPRIKNVNKTAVDLQLKT